MKTILLRWAGAIALVLLPSIASAEIIAGKAIVAPMGALPAMAMYCDNGAGIAVICSSSSVGGSVDTVVKGSSTDRGAVVGTSAVTLIPANTARRGFAIQIQSTTASCYINGSITAAADYHSLQIGPGGFYDTPITHVGTGAITIICTAASTPVYAREW